MLPHRRGGRVLDVLAVHQGRRQERGTDAGCSAPTKDGPGAIALRFGLVGIFLCLVVACSSGATPIPRSEDSGSAISAPPRLTERPVLYFDMERERDQNRPVMKGVYRDGRDSGILVRGLIGGWSRDGAWFAFLAEDGQLRLRDLQGAERTVFTAGEQEHIFLSAWQSIWSPDSRRIALLLLEGSSATAPGRRYSLVIIDVPTASVVVRKPVTSEVYERANWSPYTFRWSPDGRKILLAWQATVVFDTDSGSFLLVAPNPVFAEWAPDSSAVYYFDGWGLGDFFVKKRGSSVPVKLMDKSILIASGWQPVLLHGPLLSLSPSSSRLAVAVGSLIQLYDLKGDQAPALDSPTGRFPAGGIIATLEWSPDERSLAVLVVGAAPGARQPGTVAVFGPEVRLLDLATGQWRTLATLGFEPAGVGIDIVGLIKTLSWTP
jgi:WD40 repeat protein